MKRVLISGGGIGGLTLAYWLRRNGMSPVVIERAPSLRTGGYAIDFLGTGFDVAERMGILNALESRQVPVDRVMYVDRRGKPIAVLSLERMKELVLGKRYMPLMHQTLERILYETVRDDVDVRFGTSLAAVHQSASGVEVTFEDGSTDSFDLAFGADGIHSRLRELVAGPESSFRRFMGYAIASYRVPDRYGIGRAWAMNVEPGRMAALYACDEPGYAFAFFMWKCESPAHVPREQRLEQLRAAFAGAGWITADLLADAPLPHEIFLDIVAQIEMPSWHAGRVTFIGDACASPTLASGQGASLAMGGAYVLAQSLASTPDYADAFALYERTVRPYVEEQQKGARSFMKQFLPGTPLGIAIQRAVLKVIFRDPFIGMLRRQLNVRSILAPAT
jgi:2-polyprenyl-6-methoxyphenol hydroxylase-like FAD-dependent oxidoreductase